MSLKAGRVGVNPADVDPIDGHISPSSLEGYTKEEADAKFETQTAASSEHALLQPKTLAVPISMLSGSKLTVETALQGLNGDKVDNACLTSAFTDFVVGSSVIDNANYIYKIGKVVHVILRLQNVTATAWDTTIALIPDGYRPKQMEQCVSPQYDIIQIGKDGSVKVSADKSAANVSFFTTYICD